MGVCPVCRVGTTPDAHFCSGCGSSLASGTPAAEVRKTVSIVFGDVSGSATLGETRDPEAMRAVMTGFFETMRKVLERHGGLVEKFIGDAVMAVFGVPTVYEDDALRAVRAGPDMQRALAKLNVELARDFGTRLAIRIGVNTGEVVVGAGDRGTVATGDAVNIAARLEQAAASGNVLVGEGTWRMLRAAAQGIEVEPLMLK